MVRWLNSLSARPRRECDLSKIYAHSSTESNNRLNIQNGRIVEATGIFKQPNKEIRILSHNNTPNKYIDIRQGFFCCKKLMVLAKFHDGMDIDNTNGRISVYAPDDSFWKRHININYFEFDYCPYCRSKLYST